MADHRSRPTITQTSARHAATPALAAWVVMLAVSVLPNAVFHELAGAIPGWLAWAKLGLLAVMALAASLWREIRPLRNFFVVLLALFVAEAGVAWLQASAAWRGWATGAPASS